MFANILVVLSIAVLGAAPPSRADAADAASVPKIGFLTANRHPSREAAFHDELRRLGHVDGKSVVIEYRTADDDFERLPGLAIELVQRKVDVIVAVVTQASVAAKQATATIPIVMIGVSDPVASGLVANLARPAGNVTGTSTTAGDVVAKQVQLVRELVPAASRVAVLWNPANAVFQQLNEAKTAATRLGLRLELYEARAPSMLEPTFAEIGKKRADALLVLADPMLASQARRIAELALRHRVPSIGASRPVAEAGAAIAYGPDYVFGYRRAAVYVDRILKGAKPADLPVEQSTQFELVINGKTMRALGLTIAPALAARADQILE